VRAITKVGYKLSAVSCHTLDATLEIGARKVGHEISVARTPLCCESVRIISKWN